MKNEMPLVSLTQAKLDVARGEMDQALDNFSQAEAIALEIGMRPAVWQARAGASTILIELAREEEAQSKQDEAHAMVEEISELIQDQALKTQFLEGAEEEIRTSPKGI